MALVEFVYWSGKGLLHSFSGINQKLVHLWIVSFFVHTHAIELILDTRSHFVFHALPNKRCAKIFFDLLFLLMEIVKDTLVFFGTAAIYVHLGSGIGSRNNEIETNATFTKSYAEPRIFARTNICTQIIFLVDLFKKLGPKTEANRIPILKLFLIADFFSRF